MAHPWFYWFIPYRQTQWVIPVPQWQAEQRFADQFQQEIVLTRRFYRPVGYRGNIVGDRLRLIGPWANKRWRLCSTGTLESLGSETRIHLTLRLSVENTVVLLAVLTFFCVMASQSGIGIAALWPLSVIYGATLYSFHYEANKVQELLTRTALNQSLDGLL